MFALCKNLISENIKLITKPNKEKIKLTIIKSRLFILPLIPYIPKLIKGNDSLFCPYKYTYIEGNPFSPSNEKHGCLMLFVTKEKKIENILNLKRLKTKPAHLSQEEWEHLQTSSKDEIINGFPKTASYILNANFFKLNKKGIAEYFNFRQTFFISRKGNLIEEYTTDQLNENVTRNKPDKDETQEVKESWEVVNNTLDILTNWVFTFLRFINLPNIKIENIPIHPKDIKYYQKQKSNQIHYHILMVKKPIKTYFSSDEDHKETFLPLHQVRGHLADYTKGKGLFGKYKIRIWMPEHWRGDLLYGKINKDYKLEHN